jgi:hypothetical protein
LIVPVVYALDELIGFSLCFSPTGELNSWVLPKWRKERALAVHPFEVEDWFKQIEREHRLETSTLAEVRKIMNLVYRHGQRYGILPRTDEGNPMLFVRLPGDPHSTNDSERESVA